MSYKNYQTEIADLKDELSLQNKEIEKLKADLDLAKKVMKYYHRNRGIHPMLEDLATQYLEELEGDK